MGWLSWFSAKDNEDEDEYNGPQRWSCGLRVETSDTRLCGDCADGKFDEDD